MTPSKLCCLPRRALLLDSGPEAGGRAFGSLRHLGLWEDLARFSLCTLYRTVELDPHGAYLFCVHPHRTLRRARGLHAGAHRAENQTAGVCSDCRCPRAGHCAAPSERPVRLRFRLRLRLHRRTVSFLALGTDALSFSRVFPSLDVRVVRFFEGGFLLGPHRHL